MPRRDLNGKRVIITGASQGIGSALALELAQRGCHVVGLARDTQIMHHIVRAATNAGRGSITPINCDITNPSQREAVVQAVLEQFGGLDILVNNAGVGATGHFMECTEDTLRRIFEVNLFGLAEMTRLCLPALAQGQQPLLVNVSSVVGRRGYPARGLYSASKFAVQGLSDAMRAELHRFGIGVFVVNPGLTKTNFSENLLERSARIPLEHLRGMTAEAVAGAVAKAMEADRAEVTLTTQGKLLVLVNRFCPWVFEFFARKKIHKLFDEEWQQRVADWQKKKAAANTTPHAFELPG